MTAPAYHESLPYIETPQAAHLQAAKSQIEAELANTTTTPALPPHPKTTFSPAISTALERIASSAPPEPLDTRRYEAQDLPSAKEDAPALRSVLSKAYTSAAYLASRLESLYLLDRHGADAWLLSNYHLENELRFVESELARVRRLIDEVNDGRARRQGEVKGELESLEETWRMGVGRVLETEVAVGEMKALIRDELRKRSVQA